MTSYARPFIGRMDFVLKSREIISSVIIYNVISNLNQLLNDLYET